MSQPSCMSQHISRFQPSYIRYDRINNKLEKVIINEHALNRGPLPLIAYRGATLWNRLPGECRKAMSVVSFIKSIH